MPGAHYTQSVPQDPRGRVLFTQWDHLQRDQQADAGGYGAFNWVSESATASTAAHTEGFPEPRTDTAAAYGLSLIHISEPTRQD